MEAEYRRALRRLRGAKDCRKALPQEAAEVAAWLERAEVAACDLLPWGSNYTYLAAIRHDGAECLAIYKPKRGEIPLWDFAEGTLYRRERAAYLLSEAAGWSFVPPTVVRNGPLGVGALQLYVDADPEENYFTFGKQRVAELQRIALFDCIANNADRKAGHLLLDKSGRVWGIDHGLTFHVVPKLRTVIWDFAEQRIPDQLVEDLAALRSRLGSGAELSRRLERLLSPAEVAALDKRIEALLEWPVFPRPGAGRSIPWPPV